MTLLRKRLFRADLLLVLALGAIILLIGVATTAPRPVTLEDRAGSIEVQLRCPTCQGLSIADSPATSAAQMRELVRDQLDSGATDEEVRAFFVARYGRWILLAPPLEGVDLALWLVPGLVVALGALLVVRRATVRGSTDARTTPWGMPAQAVGRLPSLAIASGMVLALAVPIVAAVGPRLAGQQVTGGVLQSSPSIEQLEAEVGARPDDVDALVTLGDALLAANRPAEAARRYQAALEHDPDNVPALLGVGTILLAADRPDAAKAAFDRILTISPDQPDALLFRAVSRLRLEGTATPEVRADVVRFLEVAADVDPRRAMAMGLLEVAASGPPTPSRTPAQP